MEILLGEEVRGVIDTTARAPALARVLAVVGDDDVRVLSLDHLFVVCPGRDAYPVDARISVLPVLDVANLRQRLDAL